MNNDALVDYVLSPAANCMPSERLVLKLAAALIKQLDPEFDFGKDDKRKKMTFEEYRCVPDRFELIHGVVRPKDWEIPERLEAVKRKS